MYKPNRKTGNLGKISSMYSEKENESCRIIDWGFVCWRITTSREGERESVLDLDNVKHPGASNDQTKDTNDQRVRVGAATTES